MKVCLVSSGMERENIRLQPWRYLHEICKNAKGSGVEMKILSDGYPGLPEFDEVEGISVHRLRHVRVPTLVGNRRLQEAIDSEVPDALLWHISLTSLFHLDLTKRIEGPIIGVFTSPVYGHNDILRLGFHGLLSNYIHLFGAMVPSYLHYKALQNAALRATIVLSDATRSGLLKMGVPSEKVILIPPGIDKSWLKVVSDNEVKIRTRRQISFTPEDFIVAYFGPPRSIRGIDILIQATSIACRTVPGIKLLVLSRRERDQLCREEQRLRKLAERLGVGRRMRIISGFLSQEEIAKLVVSTDVVALPFKLVPSDAPLSILEAMAMGKPVVSTLVNGIPELLADGRGLLVRPNDPPSLAQTLIYLGLHPDTVANIGVKARGYASERPCWPEVARKVMAVVENQLK